HCRTSGLRPRKNSKTMLPGIHFTIFSLYPGHFLSLISSWPTSRSTLLSPAKKWSLARNLPFAPDCTPDPRVKKGCSLGPRTKDIWLGTDQQIPPWDNGIPFPSPLV